MKGFSMKRILLTLCLLFLCVGCGPTAVQQVTVAYQGYDVVLKSLIAAQAEGYVTPAMKTQITPYLNAASAALTQAATDAQAGNSTALSADLGALQVAQAALAGFVAKAKPATAPATQPASDARFRRVFWILPHEPAA